MAVMAVLSGAEGFIAIEQWALAKEKWLRTFLELPHGIASHDTFNRIFERICPEQLGCMLLEWSQGLGLQLKEHPGVIAIDGKTLRRSFDKANEKSALHLLTAWASDARVVLAQQRVDCKSNEITAIPELLNKLEIRGNIVTLDAMGCQKSLVRDISERGADFVVTLKDNHSSVKKDVQGRFAYAERRDFGTTIAGEKFVHDTHKSVDADHGRIESREVTALEAGLWFHRQHPGWDPVQSVIRVHCTQESSKECSEQTRYFLSSMSASNAELLASAIRAHWAIENDLHWTLDVQMNEDQCRVRKGHGAENLAILRRFALGRLKNEKSIKVGVKNKQLRAGWDDSYLLKLLQL
jgi:predicted transposase YbfD/YdcC